MESQQGPQLENPTAPSTRHKNKARSYLDTAGNVYKTVPSGWSPVDTAPSWTIIEIPSATTSQEELSSVTSRPGWIWMTETSAYTIDIKIKSSLTSETTNPVATSEFTTRDSVTIPPIISTLPPIPWISGIDVIVTLSDSIESTTIPWQSWFSEVDDIVTTSDSIESNIIAETTQSTESSQTTKSLHFTTITMTNNILSTATSITWPSTAVSNTPEASTSTMQWIGITVGVVGAFVLVLMFILSIIFRGRHKAPSRDNQNNINIRLENGPFNRSVAEDHPGCVHEGWNDTRG
ncbi:hypothetical protein FLONG3_4377 [Fusarium longipes]|uniref:Uncharacterized protein n=1 Tax=Fusarium longipes TaxID=694270 RepID=A0A395SYD8_9HYPO|nr:hypothetical protein FLONG3_4377 [Fusarium longipes]